jgi:hypothetical protein
MVKHKEIVQIDKKDFDTLPCRLAEHLLEAFKRDYGFSLISRGDNTNIDLFTQFGKNVFIGFLAPRIQTFLQNKED